MKWVLQQAELGRLKPVLLTETLPAHGLTPSLRYLAVRAEHDRRSRRPGRAVLAYLPSYSLAARALRSAQGGAVAIIEAADTRLSGWAAEVRATDLLTGRSHDAISDDTLPDLLRLREATDGPSLTPEQQEDARSILAGRHPPIDAGLIAGYLAAHGRSARTIRQVLRIVDDTMT